MMKIYYFRKLDKTCVTLLHTSEFSNGIPSLHLRKERMKGNKETILIVERKSVSKKDLNEVIINMILNEINIMMDVTKNEWYNDAANELFDGKE